MMKVWYKTKFESLQTAIFVMVLVLILIPTTILGAISYYQYRKILVENATVLSLENTSQIASNVEGIMRNISNVSLSFFQDEQVRAFLLAGKEEVDETEYALDRHIRNRLCYEEYVYAVNFVRMDGKCYSSSSDTDGISGELQKELMEKKGRAVFLTEAGAPQSSQENKEELYGYARCIYDINDIGQPIGFQKIYLKKSVIMHLLLDNLQAKENCILAENNDIIISTNPELEGQTLAQSFALPEKGLNEAKGYCKEIVYAAVPYPDWYVVKKISATQIEGEAAIIRQLLLSAGILAVLLCGLAGFFLSKSVLKPLGTLESSMSHIEEDDFKRKLPEKGYYKELRVLLKTFNRMTDRLDELVNQVYRAEIREKDAKIREMQAYINPHFLYNTLDTICWMSRMEQAFETCSLIEALSKLFRSAVKDGGRITSVKKEMEIVRNYIKIQECRCTDMIAFDIQIAPDTEICETVRFVLQPLIENAIVHGMTEQECSGTIRIRSARRGDNLVLSVEDEGKGADIREMEQLIQTYKGGLRGMALANVHERVRLCFGDGYGIAFRKGEQGGLIAEIIQPFCEGKGYD